MSNNPVELNYEVFLSNNRTWWDYYGEYRYSIDLMFRGMRGGEVTAVSLPLAFLIRHCLELGYKANILTLAKLQQKDIKISYKGKQAHDIKTLHQQFVKLMSELFKLYSVDKKVINEFNAYNRSLEKLSTTIYKLDEFSYSFRYPVKNDGVTKNFEKTHFSEDLTINFKEIKELYDSSTLLLMYSTDVVAEFVHPNKLEEINY